MKLTLPQQDVYFEQLMYPDDPIYNIGAKIFIKGDISYEVLNQAYIALINQHDSYRSIINQSEKQVKIQTLKEHDSFLEYMDFSFGEDADAEANEFMQQRFQVSVKLDTKELLHKFILIKVNDTHHYLFSVYHHIITDGWGTSLMFQRLVKNYNEIVISGVVMSEYPYTYRDFAIDDEVYFSSDDYENDKNYWKDRFKVLPEQLLEKTENTGKPNESKRREITIKRSVYNQLEQVSKDLGSTTFHVILGILYLYFGRKHQNTDFTIGLPVLNRGKSIFKKTVGLFMGVSPLRIQYNMEDDFENLLKNIRQQLRQDYRHQRFPLGKLIKELGLFQESQRLFNITLSYEKQNYADHFINTETKVIPLSHHSERVALAIYIREFDQLEDVKIDFDYNINYFNQADIIRVTEHFETLLSEVIDNSKKILSDYQYITATEKEQLLEKFNTTQFDYTAEATLLDSFKEQVSKNPNKIALKDQDKAFTYLELDLYSDTIAFHLQKNVNKEKPTPVAVLMNRSANLVATLLGVLKSGNAYIPLDPSFPKDRLEYIIDHSEVEQIISTHDLKTSIGINREIIDIDLVFNGVIDLKQGILKKTLSVNTAYIIYTSGSTGNPKGVAISHKSLLNFLISIQQEPKIEENDYLFSVTTQSFDISILEFFTPLISGATLYIASEVLLADPLAIVRVLEELKPTIIQATPSFYQMLYNAGWKGNKLIKILCGGDLLSETLSQKLLETNAELWNMYGPTETTIWSSCKKIMQVNEASNIGKPINNTKLYILDQSMQLLPIGSAGTIYIGGDGLAQGYFKNEELTNEKFIQSPFDHNQKIYNTGDLGRWNEKGEIEFLGRNDNQVKIRGYRIELGDIETKLNLISTIKASVVVAQKNKEQEALLLAYVIMETQEFSPAEIISSLRQELPEYMVPHAIIQVEEFPLTPNKKIDRKELSLREITITKAIASNEIPTTAIEIYLHDFYKDVLGIKGKIGITDNFFALGGHSLNAVKLINLVSEQLYYKTTLKDIFDYPTIQELSKYLENKEIEENADIEPAEENLYYALTPSQYSIWLASQQKEKSIAYNMSAVFKIHGQINKAVLDQVFLEIQKKHESLRTKFIEIGGIPYQTILYQEEAGILIHEFFYKEKEIDKTLKEYVNKAFDLEKHSLLKVALFHQDNEHSYLVFSTHHIIMDGWSLEILIKDFVDKYRAIVKENIEDDDSSKLQFKDYIAWQHKQQKSNNGKNLAFWNTYLRGFLWDNNVPFDHEPLEEKNSGAHHHFLYEVVKTSQLNAFARELNISLHTLLVGAFNMLVYKMFEKDDFCVGTVNSGRTNVALQNQLGMFVKTLPLRTQINSKHTVQEILHQTHQNLLSIDEHQDIPEAIQNKVWLDVLFVLQNPSFDYSNITVNKELYLQIKPVEESYSRLPLLITFTANEENLRGNISYNAQNYSMETIELIQLKYEKLLTEIIKYSHSSLKSIDIELPFEKERKVEIGLNF
ncbi:amino acid adenylation domain-containing protein [Flavobacterium sp. LS1R49]|uniref:Amino acid adenylation domain-containing protein n=1 Tax=Flavobacterium shii TaxID=2987687 RepID=A0A9X2ZC62_9FLAO|nr:amino acid adenylation domain-containing protein [Flavobacterium shii]MCV9927830.1 amino acid adenylation domain-containing protein [Flavobacterium shii]